MPNEESQGEQDAGEDSDFATRFSILVSELQQARIIYAFDTADHRRAARVGLAACIRFVLRTAPKGINLAMPLRELLDQLADLDKGLQGPMLTAQGKTGGQPISRGVETFRAMAAMLMEIYKWEGKRRAAAAEAAASDLNQNRYCDERGEAITPKRVEDWRDKVNEGGDGLGAQRFKALCQDLKQYSHEDARKLVFDSLALIPGNRIPNNPPTHSESGQ